MSANHMTPADQRDLTNIAWRVFREADLGYSEVTLVGESLEVHDRVLTTVTGIDYGDLALTRIARGCRVVWKSHFQQWMGGLYDALDTQRRLAVYALVAEMQRLLAYRPRFERCGHWIFLGRFRRNLDELPMTALQLEYAGEAERMVELWGHPEGLKIVLVRGYDTDDRFFDPDSTLDSHGREAFRRLAKEAVSAPA